MSAILLGVVADSHIPDRLKAIPRQVKDIFDGVTAILHAGDVSARRVLDELGEIAPVHAVGGNRDWFVRLPGDLMLEFGGVRIGLTHGHGDLTQYVVDKWNYHLRGYRERHYIQQAKARFDGRRVQVLIFGHTHRPVNRWEDGVLIFNPGSLGPDYYPPHCGPTVGLLRIESGGVTAEILTL